MKPVVMETPPIKLDEDDDDPTLWYRKVWRADAWCVEYRESFYGSWIHSKYNSYPYRQNGQPQRDAWASDGILQKELYGRLGFG